MPASSSKSSVSTEAPAVDKVIAQKETEEQVEAAGKDEAQTKSDSAEEDGDEKVSPTLPSKEVDADADDDDDEVDTASEKEHAGECSWRVTFAEEYSSTIHHDRQFATQAR